MLKNYLRVAFRNLWRHKGFSLLNILGLTIGMSACFLIFLYVKFELSYDDFHSRANRIYRVVTDINNPSEVLHFSVAAPAMPVAAKRDFPEIEKQVRFEPANLLVRRGTAIQIQEDKAALADSTFFEVFDFPLLKGNPVTALREPYSVVLSETAAKKYFGSADPMGQQLLLTGDSHPGKVTGVMKDMPENTELKADMLVALYAGADDTSRDQNWGGFGDFTYFLLKPNTSAQALQKKFPAFLERHIGKFMKEDNQTYTYILEPLKDVYLKSTRGGTVKGSMTNVIVFSIVGVFILLIAGINFINLTTARSTERAREVGLRKVIGAERRQLMGELDAAVNLKAQAALRAGLSPIVCVGETLAERDAGETLGRVQAQLDGAIADVSDAHLERIIVAYEPVWAIGTGRNATPAQAQEVHHFIRTRVAARASAVAARMRILYGGSMKPDNVRALMAEADVDGGLVGGASLTADSFVRLVKEGSTP